MGKLPRAQLIEPGRGKTSGVLSDTEDRQGMSNTQVTTVPWRDTRDTEGRRYLNR